MTDPKAPPNAHMREFLANSIPQLSGFEKLENEDLAKQLLAQKPRVPKDFKEHANAVGHAFSWLKEIGVLDFERYYHPSRGWRIKLFRCCSAEKAGHLIRTSGLKQDPPSPKPETVQESTACCSDPRPARSKKTGQRMCRNCRALLPEKDPEPAALAPKSCCENPHPVKSKKTGRRLCKNCRTELPRKKNES